MTGIHSRGLCHVLVALLFGVALAGAAEPNWKRFVDQGDWFGLRDAAASHPAPDLYAGAVAAAFHNEADAVRILHEVLARGPKSADADTAQELLVDLYYRSGRYRSALEELKPLFARHPKRRDLLQARPLFEALSVEGDMQVIARAPARITSEDIDGNLFVPVTANGATAEWLLDTGANISIVSESEAKRIGLTVRNGEAKTSDYAGAAVSFRAVIVPELRVGGVVLRNVPFGVISDKQEPFADLPEGKRGVIGIPVLIAAQTWRLSKDGSVEVGFESGGNAGEPGNLAFSGAQPLIQTVYNGAPLTFCLDTGASSTHLWPLFARRFRAQLSGRGKSQIGGVGGTREAPTAKLADFRVSAGGHELQIQDVKVLLKSPLSDSRRYYGNFGLDLVQKAERCTLDFKAMRIAFE